MRRIQCMLLSASLVGALGGCLGDIGSTPSEDGVGPGPGPEGLRDPGRVTLHRLNRVEYNNTVRDLLGTALRPADDFPADDYGYGFDNIADVLSLSPVQLELYDRAAEALTDEALLTSSTAELFHHEAEALDGSAGSAQGTTWVLSSSGTVSVTVNLPAEGSYRIAARVWGQQAGAEPARMNLLVGGVTFGPFDVPETSGNPVVIEATTDLAAGNKVVQVEFINDYYDPDLNEDRNLVIDWIEVEGPLGAATDNPIRDRLVTCDPVGDGDPCVREIVGNFARRAWRRPLTETEVGSLVGLVDLAVTEGDDVETGLHLALQAILISPHFLFRVELDPAPELHPLDDHELASRLSYFLWSSMPDDDLFAAADSGSLQDPAELEAQVRRMLDDPKSEALLDNFAGQWLNTRGLVNHAPDPVAFPEYDDELRIAMETETRLFFGEFLRSDLPLDQMLEADFGFIDARLAAHYGEPAPATDFEKVTLTTGQRGGLLTQGALLTITSNPTRTSPVKRGKWILTNLLCSEPDPPPPGVEGLEENGPITGSVRERMEQHRSDPVCASCHRVMDPLGFALENYGPIGGWRTEDNGYAVDATGELPTGETFDGAAGMSSVIGADPRFARCVAEKLTTYGLGRGLEDTDAIYVDAIAEELRTRGNRMTDLIALIAQSEPFRMRRAQKEGE
jgi:hypothetical protein